MKKGVLILLAIIYANVALSQEWGFGPKAGLNISRFTNCDLNFKPGIEAGFSGEYRIKNFAIEVDAVYTRIMNEDDFVLFPVKAKYYAIRGLNVFAGPQVDVYVTPTRGHDFSDIDRTLFSMMGGVGYKFEKGFNISVAYSHGLKSVSKFLNSRISGFHVTVGWDILQSARKSR